MEYSEYLKTKYWKSKSAEIKRARNWRCEDCGQGYNLQVHHLTYKDEDGRSNWFKEANHDLECLCSSCHYNKHCPMPDWDELLARLKSL